MRKHLVSFAVIAAIALAGALLLAHPHFKKTITVQLPSGVEATIVYNTTPANEARAEEAAVGSFVTPRRPVLKLSGELKAGSVTVPAGDYTIGVIKESENDWTMALYPGSIARGQSADMSQVIKLDSSYSGTSGTAEHMLIDISPGSGDFAGRAVLTLHFGSMLLSGALS
jgi:hypothetical protein